MLHSDIGNHIPEYKDVNLIILVPKLSETSKAAMVVCTRSSWDNIDAVCTQVICTRQVILPFYLVRVPCFWAFSPPY